MEQATEPQEPQEPQEPPAAQHPLRRLRWDHQRGDYRIPKRFQMAATAYFKCRRCGHESIRSGLAQRCRRCNGGLDCLTAGQQQARALALALGDQDPPAPRPLYAGVYVRDRDGLAWYIVPQLVEASIEAEAQHVLCWRILAQAPATAEEVSVERTSLKRARLLPAVYHRCLIALAHLAARDAAAGMLAVSDDVATCPGMSGNVATSQV